MDAQRQRIAAYAELRDEAGRVLLVRSTDEIGGKWFLPGGGVGFGESPQEALHREVLEETGHDIDDIVLKATLSDVYEWRGQQVHSVRLIYTATVVDLSRPLQHEIGGSTVEAAWVDTDRLTRLPLARYVAVALGLARG
ncbi:MAG: NUDIX domain-containing protein [Frankiaceae bacterium]|nr:NUDIX domain-containing protein [Frankiaceae bacterium]MBV9870912.1 NUDIX domain-containing protein [Frankiaceae bacterium]